MKTIKLTKPYILEGQILEEGTELVIASDGEKETVNETPSEPQNETDFGIVPNENKTDEIQKDLEEKK